MNVAKWFRKTLLLTACFAPQLATAAGFMTAVTGNTPPAPYVGGAPGFGNPSSLLANLSGAAQPPCHECGLATSVCSGHVPFATISFDLLVLNRSGVDSQDILFDAATDPTLNTSDLALGTDSDMRLGVILYHEQGYDIELSYMAVGGYSASESRTSPGGFYVFYGGTPLTPVDTYRAEYSSKMHSGEVNGRWRAHGRVTLLAGFRTVDLQEEFHIFDAPNSGVFSFVDNDLYGAQIGAESCLWTNGYCRAVGTLKAGVYNNSANVRAEATNGGGAPITLTAQADSTAFVGEAMLGFVVPIWPGELRFGYQGLWLENVALAPDQSDSLSFFAPGSIDFGTAVYHGAYFGWEATW